MMHELVLRVAMQETFVSVCVCAVMAGSTSALLMAQCGSTGEQPHPAPESRSGQVGLA